MKTGRWWITKVAALALLFAGVGLIVVYAGWLAALGVFLLLWGNNLDRGNRRS